MHVCLSLCETDFTLQSLRPPLPYAMVHRKRATTHEETVVRLEGIRGGLLVSIVRGPAGARQAQLFRHKRGRGQTTAPATTQTICRTHAQRLVEASKTNAHSEIVESSCFKELQSPWQLPSRGRFV